MTIHFQSGQILFSGSNIAMSADCCCGSSTSPQPCPTNCASCPDTFVATVTGTTGIYTGSTPATNCTAAVGTYTLIRPMPDLCDWSSHETGPSGWILSLYCIDHDWIISLVNADQFGIEFFRWTAPNTTGCPPATGWTPTTCYGCACTTGSVTLA